MNPIENTVDAPVDLSAFAALFDEPVAVDLAIGLSKARMPDLVDQPDRASMTKMFWPWAIGCLTGAGVVGFLFFEAMGGRVSTAYSVVTTLTGGLSGALIGGLFEEWPME